MSTLITIWDTNKNYAISVLEDFEISMDMLDNNTNYLYSIGTTDSKDTKSKLSIKNTIYSIFKSMGYKKKIEQVTISNNIRFVTFRNPTISLRIFPENVYMDISSGIIFTGFLHNARTIRYYQK